MVTPIPAHLHSLHLHITWEHLLGNQCMNTFLVEKQVHIRRCKSVLKLIQEQPSSSNRLLTAWQVLLLCNYILRKQEFSSMMQEVSLNQLPSGSTHSTNSVAKLMVIWTASGLTGRQTHLHSRKMMIIVIFLF